MDLPLIDRLVMRGFRAAGRLGLARRYVRLLGGLRQRQLPAIKRRLFAGYAPTSQDLLVATYAKSGTNWMLQISQQIAWRGAARFDHIHDVVPWPDSVLGFASIPAQLSDPPSSPTGLRVIKTHLERPYVPMSAEARYVVVMRDPGDAFVSSYHFGLGLLKALTTIDFTPAEWLDLTLTGRSPVGSWAEHNASWWAERERDNVLLMTFAELKRDLAAAVDRVAAFMGVELTGPERARVIEQSTFAHMKANDHRFAPVLGDSRETGVPMVRSGAQGQAGTLLTPAEQTTLRQFVRDELERLGSDLPLDALFPARE